jgi:hypothetical protein
MDLAYSISIPWNCWIKGLTVFTPIFNRQPMGEHDTRLNSEGDKVKQERSTSLRSGVVDTESIKMRAYRTLQPLSRYRHINTMDVPDYLGDLPTVKDDELLRVYENVIGQRHNCVVFSVQGTYVDADDSWTYIPYAQIQKVELSSGNKHTAEMIQLHISETQVKRWSFQEEIASSVISTQCLGSSTEC